MYSSFFQIDLVNTLPVLYYYYYYRCCCCRYAWFQSHYIGNSHIRPTPHTANMQTQIFDCWGSRKCRHYVVRRFVYCLSVQGGWALTAQIFTLNLFPPLDQNFLHNAAVLRNPIVTAVRSFTGRLLFSTTEPKSDMKTWSCLTSSANANTASQRAVRFQGFI